MDADTTPQGRAEVQVAVAQLGLIALFSEDIGHPNGGGFLDDDPESKYRKKKGCDPSTASTEIPPLGGDGGPMARPTVASRLSVAPPPPSPLRDLCSAETGPATVTPPPPPPPLPHHPEDGAPTPKRWKKGLVATPVKVEPRDPVQHHEPPTLPAHTDEKGTTTTASAPTPDAAAVRTRRNSRRAPWPRTPAFKREPTDTTEGNPTLTLPLSRRWKRGFTPTPPPTSVRARSTTDHHGRDEPDESGNPSRPAPVNPIDAAVTVPPHAPLRPRALSAEEIKIDVIDPSQRHAAALEVLPIWELADLVTECPRQDDSETSGHGLTHIARIPEDATPEHDAEPILHHLPNDDSALPEPTHLPDWATTTTIATMTRTLWPVLSGTAL